MKRLSFLICLLFPLIMQGQIDLLGGGNTYAVIVGISEYQAPKIPDLQFAHRDAIAFRDYLTSQAGGLVPEENIKLMVNEQATTGDISMALDWLISQCGPEDRAIIYFSGHGDVETSTRSNLGFLLTYNTLYNNYMAGAFPLYYMQSVISTLSNDKESNVILIADACHSGKLAGAGINGAQLTSTQLTQQFAREIKLLSCGPEEFSLEDKKWGGGRGVFSYYLIEGLKGAADKNKDYEIQLYEIHDYLEDIVPNEVVPENQFPMAIGRRSAHFAYVDPEVADAIVEKEDILAAASNQAGEGNDTTAQEFLVYFGQAMSAGNYLEPKGASAYGFFRSLEKLDQSDVEVDPLRRSLVASLQNQSQDALNAYLQADAAEMEERWGGKNKYLSYPKYLEKAAALLGPDHFMYQGLKAKQYYFQAVAQRLNGDADAALKDIRTAISISPIGGHLYNELGLIQGELGNQDAEIQAYKQALMEAPTWVLPANNLSQVYVAQGDFDMAKEWGEKAIAIDSTFAESYVQLGDAERSLGNLKAAQKAYRLAAKYNPEETEHYYRIGYIYHVQRDYDRAVEEYNRAIERDPDNGLARSAIGDILYYEGDYEGAEEQYLHLKRINSKDEASLGRLAMIAFRRGNVDESITYYKELADLYPENPSYAYSLACNYSIKEDFIDGFYWLKAALERGYNNKEKLDTDPDLEFLRNQPGFQGLVDKYMKE